MIFLSIIAMDKQFVTFKGMIAKKSPLRAKSTIMSENYRKIQRCLCHKNF